MSRDIQKVADFLNWFNENSTANANRFNNDIFGIESYVVGMS